MNSGVANWHTSRMIDRNRTNVLTMNIIKNEKKADATTRAMNSAYLISWAKTGPSGSLPKSTKKFSSNLSPPFSVSTSIFNKVDPYLKRNNYFRIPSSITEKSGKSLLLDQLRVKLLIPWGEKRRGHVEPFPVQTELQHLWRPPEASALDNDRFRLCLRISIYFQVSHLFK